MKKTSCELCYPEIRNDQKVVMENEHCLFLQLEDQEIEGAGLIVPRSHQETVFDLTEEQWRATYELLQRVKQHIDAKHQPDGYNVGWNCGEVGGQHLFHAHMHVI